MMYMHDAHERRDTPGWLLDELARAGRENLDAAHVERYDGKMDARAADEVALLRSWGLTPQSVVVDLGGGTGQFALAAARVCRRVVAVDVSPVMRERLRRKRNDAEITNLDIAAAGFLTYDHVGDPADVVYSRFALHHLPDFWKVIALRRVRAMLRPGGVFRLWDVGEAVPQVQFPKESSVDLTNRPQVNELVAKAAEALTNWR
jgi:SAM-dependent methyltransferase